MIDFDNTLADFNQNDYESCIKDATQNIKREPIKDILDDIKKICENLSGEIYDDTVRCQIIESIEEVLKNKTYSYKIEPTAKGYKILFQPKINIDTITLNLCIQEGQSV